MSAAVAESPSRPSRTLCLGDALVDLVGEAPGRALTEVDRFAPHFGGVAANVAVVAARLGARVTLAGAAGDDDWGRWLLERLRCERVDVSLFSLVEAMRTPLAFTTLNEHGEPSYDLVGPAAGTLAHALRGQLEPAVRGSAALFVSTNTLVDPGERCAPTRWLCSSSGRSCSTPTCACIAGARAPTPPQVPTPACAGRCWSAPTAPKPS
jgi:sugar/nucleoside kinase (ribokinase family)